MKLPINLKHFKKTAEDKNTSTLTHKDGHKLTIAHAALSPELHKQIKSLPLANGGEVAAPQGAKEMSQGASESESQYNARRDQKQSEQPKPNYGNKIQAYADGGEIKKEFYNPQSMAPMNHDQAQAHYAEQKKQQAEQQQPPQKYADGGDVQAAAPIDPAAPATDPLAQLDQNATPVDTQPTAKAPAGIEDLQSQQPQPQVDPAIEQKRSLYNSIVSQQSPLDAKTGNPNADNQQLAQFGPNGEEPKNFNSQAWNQAETSFNNQAAQSAATAGAQTAKIIEDNKSRVAAGLKPMAVPAAAEGAAPSAQAPGAQQGTQAQGSIPNNSLSQSQNDPYGNGAFSNAFVYGADESASGIQNEAAAVGNQGKAESKVLGDQMQFQQDLMQHAQQKMADNETEYHNFVQDVQDQHIDPNHYMSSLGVAGNIASAIGLILGGMGGGATGQENPALHVLSKNIDRDIEAQKAELGKKENLLSANMNHFKNIHDAVAMTSAMQAGIVINKLKQAEANAKDPIAKARAQQAIGQMYMDKVAPNLQKVAMNQTLMAGMGQAQQDPDKAAQMVKMYRMMGREPEAKALEEKIVPGIGVSMSQPVPAAVRETLIAKQQLDSTARDFYNWASKHSGSLDPQTINIGKTKAAELQSLYRNSINGGVFKKGEQEFIDNIVDSDPTKFFNKIRVLPKLKEVIDNNSSQFETLKKGYGLPAAQSAAPQSNDAKIQQALTWAKQNPNTPHGKEILKRFGNK